MNSKEYNKIVPMEEVNLIKKISGKCPKIDCAVCTFRNENRKTGAMK